MTPGEGLRRQLLSAFVLAALAAALLASQARARDIYVANETADSLSVIDSRTNQPLGSPIPVGAGPLDVAISPDGTRAYVTNADSENVSVINTQTNQVGSPIKVGMLPDGIAISPDGKRAYVSNLNSRSVSVINLQTSEVSATIPTTEPPRGIAITPDGKRAYVATFGFIVVINTETNQPAASDIGLGPGVAPDAIAITPDGKTAYAANFFSNTVFRVNTQTNEAVNPPIEVGDHPSGVAITPDGRAVYVANFNSHTVSVISTQTNEVTATIPFPIAPNEIAITADGKLAYVTGSPNAVSVIDIQTNQVVGSPITVSGGPNGIAIGPDQPPLAAFATPRARPGVPVAFDASASSDPDGVIAGYDWAFGDGQSANASAPLHTYGRPGTYQVTLRLTDDEGCSTSTTFLFFAGQPPFCNGSTLASKTQGVKVAYPGVRLRCPRIAKPNGCKFQIQAVTKQRRGKAESLLSRAKLKAGRSATVSLKPKAAFRRKLAAARKVLVKETVTINGAKRTRFNKLKIVQ